jgi:DNA-binding SARP family transcriptional activator
MMALVTTELRFSVLGPVRAWSAGAEIELGSPQQRTVLAVLLLRQGSPITLDEFVDTIWDGEPPRTAGGTIRTYVSRLRRILATADDRLTITAPDGGYLLRMPSDVLDLTLFRAHVARARAARQRGDLEAAADELRDGLELWRGTPLTGLPGAFAAARRDHLSELRIAALGERIGIDLALGRHAQLTPELSALVAEHPAREVLREQYMVALYGAGRRAEALDTYREFHRRLAGEQQAGPGPGLRRAHQRILAADPALRPAETDPGGEPPVPTHLPTAIPDFIGRDAELAEIIELLGRAGEVPVVAVTGMGGIGKSALAVRVAHDLRAAFPDGHVYVALHPAADPHQVLGSFLRAYGVAEQELPEAPGERIALWRTVTAERRILLVLDDTRDSRQVRDLLPATPGGAVLVTSRRRILDLPGAHWIKLGPLSPGEALALLERIVGAERVDSEREAAQRLLAECSHVPQAIRLVSARLLAGRQWTMADAGHHLDDELRRHHFDYGYGELTRGQARAFRLLARPEGPHIGVTEAAARLELPERETETILEALADVHLIEAGRRGSYHYLELIRSFARHRAEAEDARAAPARVR